MKWILLIGYASIVLSSAWAITDGRAWLAFWLGLALGGNAVHDLHRWDQHRWDQR